MAHKLTREEEAKVRAALQKIQEAEQLCREMAAAGYDCRAQDVGCQFRRRQLEAILQQWGTRSKD